MITKRFVALSGTALVLLLASCGGGQPFPESQSAPAGGAAATGTPGAVAPTGSPTARLLAAVQRTTQARTARLAINMSITGLGDVGNITFTGTGAMDLANKRLAMKLDGEDAGETISLEMRVVGNTAYIGSNGRWISQSVAATGTSTPVPSDYLQYLQGISGSPHAEGHEVVRGVDTIRYGATVDLNRALARLGSSAERAAVQHALAQFGLSKFPVTVWVDATGRLRKMQLSIDLAGVAAKLGAPGTDPKIVESIELYDFGAPVDVHVPAGAQSVTSVNQDRAAQADLRNALTAEKVNYTDQQAYTADASLLKQIESTLDWGGKVRVAVGSSTVGTDDIVCVSELSKSGKVMVIADIAGGPTAGTYYGEAGCPILTARAVSAMAPSW